MEFKTILFLILAVIVFSKTSNALEVPARNGKDSPSGKTLRETSHSPSRKLAKEIAERKNERRKAAAAGYRKDATIARKNEDIARKDKLIVQKNEAIDGLEIENVLASKQVAELRATLITGVSTIGLTVLIVFVVWTRNQLKVVSKKLLEEQKELHEQQRVRFTLEERVSQLQRMESLGMLAGGVAHDFNNLLVGVICNAEVLELEGSISNDFAKERLRQIIQSADKAADLSRQMLAYTGKTQLKKNATEINDLVTRMQRVLMSTLGDNMHLEFDLSPDPVVADIDTTQIEQVLLNLVSNARHASHDHGEVIIRTGIESIDSIQEDKSLFGARDKGGTFVFIEVEDSGDGINKEDVKRIFEPFFSSRKNGRGLGLAVVYGIVKGHDGLIRTESYPGKGTCFRVLVPFSSAPKLPQSIAPRPLAITSQNDSCVSIPVVNSEIRTRQSGEKLSVLVVDDEAAVRDFAKALLESQGWQVVIARNGFEALEILDDSSTQFECVLLDMVMPELGAKQVLDELKNRNSSVSVILMSGHSETQLEPYRENEEVCEVLSKPFRTQELIDAIEVAVNRQQAGSL